MATELKPKRKGNYHHNGNQKHGLYHENANLFNTWQTMKGRCENPNRPKYADYGGRGIKVCSEWHEASNFIMWALINGYKKGLQLDRIDNDGDYCPENCRFVTPRENSRNRRNTKRLTVNGETRTVVEWCEQLGLSQYTVYDWIRKKGNEYAGQRIAEAWNRRVPEIVKVETNFFDKEEIFPDCTVQVLTNTATGDVSVGWWKNDN